MSYKQLAKDYLERLENKPFTTLKSTIDKEFYLSVESEYNKERELHCECSARLKASKREEYLDVIRHFNSLFGEVNGDRIENFNSKLQSFFGFERWYFDADDEALIAKLEKTSPSHALIKAWKEANIMRVELIKQKRRQIKNEYKQTGTVFSRKGNRDNGLIKA